MKKLESLTLALLRVSLGAVFFYGGLTKVLNPEWSALGYIENASTFPALYEWFALSTHIEWVNMLNKWGLLLIGASLILGVFVRLTAPLGAVVMLLYYFPILTFPYAGDHAFLVDEHIVYVFTLLLLAFRNAGKKYGLDALFFRRDI